MNQAQASLARIQNGEYTPDSAAVGFNFEDGSALIKVDDEWRVAYPCCGGGTWQDHRENVERGKCSAEALSRAFHAEGAR